MRPTIGNTRRKPAGDPLKFRRNLSKQSRPALTSTNSPQAYFETHTRVWELALGGLLALTPAAPLKLARLRLATAAIGIGSVVTSAFVYSATTKFPGVAALLPTLGTAMVIWAGDVQLRWFRGLNTPVLRYIGDRSYSIYLWHWPLVAFTHVYHEAVGPRTGLTLIVATALLSHASHKWIEERFRYPQQEEKAWSPLGNSAGYIAGLLLAVATIHFVISGCNHTAKEMDPAAYPGAGALLSGVIAPQRSPLPALATLKADLPVVYAKKCHQNQIDASPVRCDLGKANGNTTVVIAGDSHAAHWIPALEAIARERGWRLVSFTKSGCPLSRVEIWLRGKPYTSCIGWVENTTRAIIELKPALLFVSQTVYSDVASDRMTKGVVSVWRDILGAGIPIMAIQQTPQMSFRPDECLKGDPSQCRTRRIEGGQNIYLQAIALAPQVKLIDMIDGICGHDYCDAVVGNIIVWRDAHHLTATYARTLAPLLLARSGL